MAMIRSEAERGAAWFRARDLAKDSRGTMIYVTHAAVSEYPDPKLAV